MDCSVTGIITVLKWLSPMKKLLKGRTMPAYIRDKPSILVHRGINPLKKSGSPVTRISTTDNI